LVLYGDQLIVLAGWLAGWLAGSYVQFCITSGDCSSFAVATRRYGVRTLHGPEISMFSKLPKPAVGPTQPTIQWASAFFSGCWVLSSPYPVLILRACGAKPLLPVYTLTFCTGSALPFCQYICYELFCSTPAGLSNNANRCGCKAVCRLHSASSSLYSCVSD
jgi:hypothetical protein